jgi:hypothetical protein
MVRAGADVCLAFVRNESSGARGCADAAKAAGVRTVEWTRSGVSVFTVHARRVFDVQGRDAWRVDVAERSDSASEVPMGTWLTHAGDERSLPLASSRLRMLVAEKLCIRPDNFDWLVVDKRPKMAAWY